MIADIHKMHSKEINIKNLQLLTTTTTILKISLNQKKKKKVKLPLINKKNYKELVILCSVQIYQMILH